MRLTMTEVGAIKETLAAFDPAAEVWLFGSRARDDRRGGDIDLMVFSAALDDEARRRLKLRLYDRLGEQKIDLIVHPPGADDPLVRIAKIEGVKL